MACLMRYPMADHFRFSIGLSLQYCELDSLSCANGCLGGQNDFQIGEARSL